MAATEMDQFGQDLKRVAALARTFFGHREAIGHLEDLATGRGKEPGEAMVLSAAWVGYGMARVWPQGPWQLSAVKDMLRGGLESALGGGALSGGALGGDAQRTTDNGQRTTDGDAQRTTDNGQRTTDGGARPGGQAGAAPAASPKDMPRPPAEMLDGLTANQRRFLAFAFGVVGGISTHRPVQEGPLASIVSLAHLLAPLVCVPRDALVDENTISGEYLQALAESLDLDVDELIALGNQLGLSLT